MRLVPVSFSLGVGGEGFVFPFVENFSRYYAKEVGRATPSAFDSQGKGMGRGCLPHSIAGRV